MAENTPDHVSQQDKSDLPAIETSAQGEPIESPGERPPEIESARASFITLSAIRANLRQIDSQVRQLESQLQSEMRSAVLVPQRFGTTQRWYLSLAALTALLVIGVRFYKLNTIQTDLYGDIQIVHQFIKGVQSGTWPFEYVLGVGPIYHYLVLPIILVTGLNYLGLKISAVIVSLGALLTTYTLARRLIDEYFALLALAIAGVSSWFLTFSRLGISLILVPLLVACALWLIVRVIQDRRPLDVVACALVSALGLYSYPQAFVLPAVSFLTLLSMRLAGHPVSWADLRRFVIVSILGAVPLLWMFYQAPENFTRGYIGVKFFADADPFGTLLHNIRAAALAYHVEGDSIFRSNPMYLPHLDRVSGLLLLAGFVFWLLPARHRWSPVLLVPFILLHIPSVLVLGRPTEVPSAGRTLGAAPIAYILVASGIWWLVQYLAGKGWRRIGLALAGCLLALIVFLNMQRYFGDYIGGLPYHDTSIGGQIATYADSLPPETQVYIVGCCWEGAMPELPFVQLVASRPQNLQALDRNTLTCDQLAALEGPTVLIWSFREPLPAPLIEECQQWVPAQLYVSPKGLPVFHAAPLLKERE